MIRSLVSGRHRSISVRGVGEADDDMFICGNDTGAKETVVEVLKEFGWLRLCGAPGSGMFNVKIIR